MKLLYDTKSDDEWELKLLEPSACEEINQRGWMTLRRWSLIDSQPFSRLIIEKNQNQLIEGSSGHSEMCLSLSPINHPSHPDEELTVRIKTKHKNASWLMIV